MIDLPEIHVEKEPAVMQALFFVSVTSILQG